jgi:hypothetical protein
VSRRPSVEEVASHGRPPYLECDGVQAIPSPGTLPSATDGKREDQSTDHRSNSKRIVGHRAVACRFVTAIHYNSFAPGTSAGQIAGLISIFFKDEEGVWTYASHNCHRLMRLRIKVICEEE